MINPITIIDFVYANRGRWLFENWTKEQIGIYLLPYYKSNKMCIVTTGTDDAIEGLIVFDFPELNKLYVQHLIATKPGTMARLLDMLDKHYPNVTAISGLRKFKRDVNFNKQSLRKIYGR